MTDTSNGVIIYIENDATQKGDYRMFITKRQLREDEKILELSMANTKKFADMAEVNNVNRHKALMQELKRLRSVYRLNQHLLNGNYLSSSESALYIENTQIYWTNVA